MTIHIDLSSFAINNYPIVLVLLNVFLALIPCWVIYYLGLRLGSKKWSNIDYKAKIAFVILFIVWFFFFPNTAYLFTMVRHLLDHCTDYHFINRICYEESWMEFFFFAYALIGIPTFVYALKNMSAQLGTLFHPLLKRLFPIVMIPFTSIGVMLGLLERFNSWEIFYDFKNIFNHFLMYFQDLSMIWNLFFITFVLYFIYYVYIPILKKVI